MKTTFIHITDSHLLGGTSKLYNIPIKEVHLKIIEEIKVIENEIDFILHTGDISDNGSKESYFTAIELFTQFNKPVYWIAGNHDDLNIIDTFKNEKNIKPDKFFSVNDTYFILLNTVVLASDGKNRSSGVLTTDELQFLENSLNQTNSNPTIIALHHPPIKSNTWKDERMLTKTSEFFDIINKYNNVKLVLYGHQHQAQETIIDDIKFYCPPAASFQFDRNLKWKFENSNSGFGIVNINDDNTIDCLNRYLDFEVNPIYEGKNI